MGNVKITTVDYNAMPSDAATMRETGKNMNAEFLDAYTNVNDLHQYWKGERYKNLIVEINNMIDTINEILTLVVHDIPYQLECIANNYSMADRGETSCTPSDDMPTAIEAIEVPEDATMKFQLDNVENVYALIKANFENAKDYMDELEEELNATTWTTADAEKNFKTQFTTLKGNIEQSIDDIKKDFDDYIQAAEADIQAAENSNDVNYTEE